MAAAARRVTPADLARRLVAEVGPPLGVGPRAIDVADVAPADDWAASGAMALTGYADGPPLPAPGAPASAVRAALAVVAACAGAAVPGVEVLGERAALAGLRRQAPFSPGGAFRALPARDGWLGLSLARPADLELLPALTEHDVGADPWAAVAAWLRTIPVARAAARTQLLGLPAAPVPARPGPPRRPGVLVTAGGPRRPGAGPEPPVVVDLTSLWAGPLCARLLGLAGARVIKVESAGRPDGARLGPPAFFDLLHGGHELVTLDFAAQRDELRELVGRADVVLEASRPRALQQLGIDAAQHVARGVIWASITAYGRGAGQGLRVGFGDDVAAGAGLVAWSGGQPVPAGDAIADPLAGVHAAAAVAIALLGRRGALLDVSMHDVAARAAAPG